MFIFEYKWFYSQLMSHSKTSEKEINTAKWFTLEAEMGWGDLGVFLSNHNNFFWLNDILYLVTTTILKIESHEINHKIISASTVLHKIST